MTQEEKQPEVWKPIPNYEEYEVSNLGRVKRLAYDKPVQQYTIEAQFIKEYPSAIEASRELGLAVSGIVNCCNRSKKYTTCGGFIWKYTNSDKQITPVSKILQINKEDGSALNTWDSITEASKSLSISRTAITNCISGLSKTAGGYIWKKI